MTARRTGFLAAVAAVLLAASPAAGAPAGDTEAKAMKRFLQDEQVEEAVRAIVERHGPGSEARARLGAAQVADAWRAGDGDAAAFRDFCVEQFVADPARVADLLHRFEGNLEALSGHGVALTRSLREAVDLDLVESLPVDLLFATLNPFDHVSEDVFRTKVAFVALLNFPLVRLDSAGDLSRAQWAEARLTGGFALRIPGEVRARVTEAYARAEDYIARYNIHLHGLVTDGGRRPFPEGLKLISHWGLRDHIKALYSDPAGNLEDQRLIYTVMERIVRQEIPAAVIDNPDLDWDPVANVVKARDGTPADPQPPREDDVRFARLRDVFLAEREQDAHAPRFPTLMARRFGYDREIPEATVRGLLEDVLSAPVAKDVAALIRRRLGRPLQPWDVWYDGFKARSAFRPEDLDARVRDRFPTLDAFSADLPNLLQSLGFAPGTAGFLAEHIAVDPARGAGHAMGAGMRSDRAHLRTRVPRSGMDYKGFNIAIHELGHCVEQVFTLNRVDSTLMMGVPNTAFTEAMAFLFQDRDLELLGLGKRDATARALAAVDTYWMTFEIAGVGLLDMATWHWMYDHPDATPAEIREAVVREAVALWNRFYAPVLGVRDSPVLAIYSHMIAYGLYLPDYPVGHLIQFQIEKQIEGKSLAAEMERMCVQGRLSPDRWMRGAVGGPLSARPLVDAAKAGLKVVGK